MTILHLVLAIGLLFAGRRLFWLFVGGVGFVMGSELTEKVLTNPTVETQLAVGLILGLLGALAAVFLQKVAISAAGFLAGGGITLTILETMGWHSSVPELIPFALGGLVGMLLLWALFDGALVVLSAALGASLIVSQFDLDPRLGAALMVGLACLGAATQLRLIPRKATYG